MKTRRYRTSRQKACLTCSAAKAKCDRRHGRCTRCSSRNLQCAYYRDDLVAAGRVIVNTGHIGTGSEAGFNSNLQCTNVSNTNRPLLPNKTPDVAEFLSWKDQSAQSTRNNSPSYGGLEVFGGAILSPTVTTELQQRTSDTDLPDFLDTELWSKEELVCSINADDISNRWLSSYIPLPGQKPKTYPASITAYIYRILKAYAALTVRGRGAPPFVHYSQMLGTAPTTPLSTCLTLVRMCEKPLPGSESVASDILQREMNSLYEQHGTYDGINLLAAYQSYLIYSLVLYFTLGQSASPFLREAMSNLQNLACSASRGGVVCKAERCHTRPRWEAWIIAEAKRRTLYTMYLFDSVLSAQDSLPTMLGIELSGLPAPSERTLWRASTRQEFEAAYHVFLSDWTEGLCIDELWPNPEDMDVKGIQERRGRVDQWLEGVDEFGTMMFAVTSCTHGNDIA